jgi:hypothetical protein
MLSLTLLASKRDHRIDCRRLARPWFTALACCTLGVGIAAITIGFGWFSGTGPGERP